MVGIGVLFVMGGGYLPGTIPQVLGALSVLLASVNVSGGFVITKRMLDMFKRKIFREHRHPEVLIIVQVQLTLPSTPGCIQFRPLFLQVPSLLLQIPVWQV